MSVEELSAHVGFSYFASETIMNMKFTARQLTKMSQKSQKNSVMDKRKVKEAIEKGNSEGAKIYAENAIRNEKQALNYLKYVFVVGLMHS